MSNIKKAYQEIVSFLEENSDKKVKSILEDVIAMASAKTTRGESGGNFIKDSEGNVVAIFCYYFKRWMPLVGDAAVEFGAKKNTATGLNSMCKEGVSHWTKQQRVAKQAQADLLNKVAKGEVAPENILDEQKAIEDERKAIVETELGFATKEDIETYLSQNSIALAA